MITTNIEDILFSVKVLPTYAKNGKQDIFAGYATVNIADNKVLQQVSERYKLRTNAELIALVQSFYPTYTPQFAYYRNNKAYFHIIGTLQTVKNGVQLGIEIINSYDANVSAKACLVYKVLEDSSYYIYTGIDLGLLFKEEEDPPPINSVENILMKLDYDMCQNLANREQYSYQWAQLPNKVKNNMADKLVSGLTHWNALRYCAMGIVVSGWYKKSFEQARKWLVNFYEKGKL